MENALGGPWTVNNEVRDIYFFVGDSDRPGIVALCCNGKRTSEEKPGAKWEGQHSRSMASLPITRQNALTVSSSTCYTWNFDARLLFLNFFSSFSVSIFHTQLVSDLFCDIYRFTANVVVAVGGK